MALNKVMLIGNVGKDPEIKSINNRAIASFTLATTDRWTDRNGNKQERTEWHNLTAFGKTAEFVQNYLRKGSIAYVEGKLTYNIVEGASGRQVYTNITVETVQLVSKPVQPKSGLPVDADDDMPF